MAHVYPILLDISQRQVVIIGGGRVAARKAQGLIEAGALKVRVISPQFVVDFPHQCELVTGTYQSSQLDGAVLIFAATNKSDINSAIVRDAHAKNILVNRADLDEEAPGDFVTPAKYQDKSVLLTVSAASAALAASIRDALQRRWDPKWTKMADIMNIMRPWVRGQSHMTQEERAMVFRDMASSEAMDVLDSGGIDALKSWLIQKHPNLK